ncbi:MAG: hypothetical protein LAT57_13005 [Balneolales bacterium]|nr:hypothetical protein [Balneolales bacterium]
MILQKLKSGPFHFQIVQEESVRTDIGVWIDGRIEQSDEHEQGDLLKTAFAIPEGFDNIQWAVVDAHKKPLSGLRQFGVVDDEVWIQI